MRTSDEGALPPIPLSHAAEGGHGVARTQQVGIPVTHLQLQGGEVAEVGGDVSTLVQM